MINQLEGLHIRGEAVSECLATINLHGQDEVIDLTFDHMKSRDPLAFAYVESVIEEQVHKKEPDLEEKPFRAGAAITYLAAMCGPEGCKTPNVNLLGIDLLRLRAHLVSPHQFIREEPSSDHYLFELLVAVFFEEKIPTDRETQSIVQGSGLVWQLLNSQILSNKASLN